MTASAVASGTSAAQLRGRRFAPTGVFVELPSVGNYFYRQHLNPGKPTLLLAHGMVASSGLNWYRLFPALEPHFNIVAPDVRGHGRSWPGSDRFSFERAADDLAELLGELQTGPVIAVGYSMGGAVVQHLWHRHRDKVAGLVLAASNYKARVARHEQLVVLPLFAAIVGLGQVAELFGHLPRGLLKRFLPKLSDSLHEDEVRWALDEMRRTRFKSIAETGREMALHDASGWLHEIDVPTTVVVTEKDRAIPPAHQREMAELVHGAQIISHDDGHLACMDPAFGEVLAGACMTVLERCPEAARWEG